MPNLRMLPHKVMENDSHPRVKMEFLRTMHPNLFENAILPLFAQYEGWLQLAQKKVNLWVEHIKYKARMAGYEIIAYGRSCQRKETTCLGKYPTHYPYFKITKPFKKYIKKTKGEEIAFLKEIGLSDEEIEIAESWFDALAVIHQLRNGTAKGLGWLGIIEVDFGKEKGEVITGHVRKEG